MLIINKNPNQSFYDCKNMFMKKWFLHKNSNLKDEFKDDIINKFDIINKLDTNKKFDTEQQMNIFTGEFT